MVLKEQCHVKLVQHLWTLSAYCNENICKCRRFIFVISSNTCQCTCMYAYILTKLFWWYFKIMVPHYGLQKYTYIFWSFNVLLQFYLVNRSLKFLVVIDHWQHNPKVCDQYHMYPFSSLSSSSSHFQWPLQCVELMKRSAGLWSREMGPTTVTWPDWGTGSQEIPRMVMIRIFGGAIMSLK